ncbi:hypothetical protein F5148DRAFT_1146151 [Russula earlei]|uniref:Uncharacterized protein n=1 Tax=Russula earlei TaxID=71964 RepID=A0ACC0UMY4_9AGAM|nr:hypothetical protein F5148DRAFT_1146151 [Russula earlei]
MNLYPVLPRPQLRQLINHTEWFKRCDRATVVTGDRAIRFTLFDTRTTSRDLIAHLDGCFAFHRHREKFKPFGPPSRVRTTEVVTSTFSFSSRPSLCEYEAMPIVRGWQCAPGHGRALAILRRSTGAAQDEWQAEGGHDAYAGLDTGRSPAAPLVGLVLVYTTQSMRRDNMAGECQFDLRRAERDAKPLARCRASESLAGLRVYAAWPETALGLAPLDVTMERHACGSWHANRIWLATRRDERNPGPRDLNQIALRTGEAMEYETRDELEEDMP